jgi:hypothetical protein
MKRAEKRGEEKFDSALAPQKQWTVYRYDGGGGGGGGVMSWDKQQTSSC